jgi:phospholipid/cholesterol/gamma-HCH transport system ATP-binding protein
MIIVENVGKSYGAQKVLDGISLRIRRQTVSAIVGGSGQGKTVLLRILTGLERADSGEVYIDGEDIGVMGPEELNRVRRKFGVLFQEGALFDYLNVYENVAFPVREHRKLKEKEIRNLVTEKLAEVDLSGAEQKSTAELSGGMRKRVALARALALDPEIIFFDEPTTGLDPVTATQIYDLIAATRKERPVTYVIVTHDVERILPFTDEIFMIHNGKLISAATPREIETNPDHVIHRFMVGKLREISNHNSALNGPGELEMCGKPL